MPVRARLSKRFHSGQSQTMYAPSQQGGSYAPPPGPPPQWGQWQTPYSPPGQDNLTPANLPNHNRSVSGSGTSTSARARIASPEEEVKRLFKVCTRGKGQARLLQEAVAYAKPEDAKDNPLIDEFSANCRASQEIIFSTIPWATAESDKARERSYGEETREEKLLAELLATNQELLDALESHEDLIRTGKEHEERAKKSAERKMRALDAITSFEPTPAESALVNQIFTVGDPSDSGTLSAHAAQKLFTGSGLAPEVLARIWEIANVEENEMFNKHCIGVALRLVGHAQQGKTVLEELVNESGQLAFIDGFNGPRSPQSSYTNAAAGPSSGLRSPGGGVGGFNVPSSSSTSAMSSSVLPPLTPQDRAKFVTIFYNSGPENGVLSAQRAREVLLKSQLPTSTLGLIWELADTQYKGYLDLPSFCVAMYLVQGCMSGQITTVPSTLPPFLYAEAAQAGSSLSPTASPAGPQSPLFRMPELPPSPPAQVQPQTQTGWGVSSELKASADAFFDVLDEQRKGYLDRDTASLHFLQSGLPQEILTRIWDLADVDADSRLTRDEFALAMYFVQCREAGQDLPSTLPANLVPPSSQQSLRPHAPSFPQISVSNSNAEDLLIDLDAAEETIPMPLPSISIPSHTSPQATPPTPLSPSTSAIWPSSVAPSAPPFPPRSMPSSLNGSASSSPSMSVSESGPPPVTSTEWTWEIPPADRASSNKFFDTLDPWKQGYVEGEAVVGFLSKSKLGPETLAEIWDLADRDHTGRLTKEQFAVVMFIVRGRLAGTALPESVPDAMFEPAPAQPAPAVAIEAAQPEEPPPPYQENILGGVASAS